MIGDDWSPSRALWGLIVLLVMLAAIGVAAIWERVKPRREDSER